MFWLIFGLATLWLIAASSWIDKWLSTLISRSLKRWTHLEVRDYAGILHLAGEYGVMELQVEEQDWLANKTLNDLNLSAEGVLVLGIHRANGRYLGAPQGNTRIKSHDNLIVYGRSSVLNKLDQRRADTAGEQEHQQLVVDQQRLVQEQEEDE